MINVLYPLGSMTFNYTPGFQATRITPMILSDLESLRGRALIVFEGGADIDPALYGAKHTHTHWVSPSRDAWEKTCYDRAMEVGIPFIGLCRGHQLVAALNGGTLYQDIGKEVGRDHGSQHRIVFEQSDHLSEFERLMASNPTGCPDVVNSMHHQAVKRVPGNATVLARHARDGVVEALWYERGITVQWHPEFLGHTDFLHYMAERFSLDKPENNMGGGDRVPESGTFGRRGREVVAPLHSA